MVWHRSGLDRGKMIGRDLELARVLSGIESSQRASLSVQLVFGEAGIGKTTLLQTVLGALPETTVPILCRTDEADNSVPYALFAELSHQLRISKDVDDAYADALDAIFEKVRRAEPGDYVYQLVNWGRDIIEANPIDLIVIACDDIHNLDSESLRLLTPLIGALKYLPVALVFTCRPGFDSKIFELRRLIDRLADAGQGAVIELEPFSAEELSALVADQGSRVRLAPDTLKELVTATAGNPFLAEQYLAITESTNHARPGPEADAQLPGRVVGRTADMILLRFFPTEGTQLALAQLLSLFRGSVRLANPAIEQVRSTFKLSAIQVATAWDALVASGTLRANPDGDSYSFIHPLVREALYESIGAVRRAHAHRLVAEALDAAPVGQRQVFEVATHYYLGGGGAGTAAADASLRAAKVAEDTASSVAVLWLRRSLELLGPDDPRRIWTYFRLIYACLAMWAPREAMEASREADAEFGGRPEAEFIALPAAVAYFYGGRPELSIEALDRIDLEMLDPSMRFWAMAYRPVALYHLGRQAEAHIAYEECLAHELDADLGPESGTALSDATLAGYALMSGRQHEHEQHLRRALSFLREVPGPNRREITATLTYIDMLGPGRLEEMSSLLAAAYDRPLSEDELGLLGPSSATAWAFVYWLRGDLGLARRVAHQGAQQAYDSGATLVLASLQAIDTLLCVELGEIREARQVAESMEQGPPGNHGLVSLAKAKLAEVDGRVEDACTLLEDYLAEASEMGSVLFVAAVTEELVRLYCAAERVADARRIADETYQQIVPLGWGLQTMWATRARGIAYSNIEDLKTAKDICDQLGTAFESLNCELILAEFGDKSAERLTRLLDGFDALGANRSERRTRAELRRRGIPVPRRERAKRSNPANLSEVESAVMRLVLDGLSNREIASTLYISVKTVELYLSRIYEKEGVRNRVQLTTKLLS